MNIIPVDMDPVVEEEEKNDKGDVAKINSGRMIFMTDNKEDVAVQPSNFLSSSSIHFVSKDYSMEYDSVIEEDNNENITEEILSRKNHSFHKMDDVIDKEENLFSSSFSKELNMKPIINSNIFETINEDKDENVEEQVLQIKKNNTLSSKVIFFIQI